LTAFSDRHGHSFDHPRPSTAYAGTAQLTPGRWFPLEYLKRVLALNDPMAVELDTPLADILRKYDERVPYAQALRTCYEQVAASHSTLCNWHAEDFALTISDAEVGGDTAGRTALQVLASDKKALQSACVPESRSYYKYARTQPVPEWGRAELMKSGSISSHSPRPSSELMAAAESASVAT